MAEGSTWLNPEVVTRFADRKAGQLGEQYWLTQVLFERAKQVRPPDGISKTFISKVRNGHEKCPNWLFSLLVSELDVQPDEMESLKDAERNAAVRRTGSGPDLFTRYARSSLACHIRVRDFESLVRERTRDFVGREYVVEAIDRLIADNTFPSGYIIVSGEPGIGKTALLAHLVRSRQYVHHFNSALEMITSAGAFLENTCAQLIVRYQLPYDVLPEKAVKDGGFLRGLLAEAVSAADGDPVVVLVDALDEAEEATKKAPGPTRPNPLHLPRVLPERAFIIVTMREHARNALVVDRTRQVELRDDAPENLKDVRRYVDNFVSKHRNDMVGRIAAWGVDEQAFSETITEKSQGNFMYLVYVLQDIRDGKLNRGNIGDIRKLPGGLKEYYHLHWDIMRSAEPLQFDTLYKPVVCQLAVAREPVSIEQLSDWTSLGRDAVERVIRTWRQFLNEDAPEGRQPLYRIYHSSFREFLNKVEGLDPYEDKVIAEGLKQIPNW